MRQNQLLLRKQMPGNFQLQLSLRSHVLGQFDNIDELLGICDGDFEMSYR